MFNVNKIIYETNLYEMVEKAGGVIQHNRCACPIHGGNDTNSFSIYHKDGKDMWTCFSGDCGGGDVIDFVQKWRGWDFKQACEFLGGNVQADPYEMKRLADERMLRASLELEQKKQQYEAAHRELQAANRHLQYHKSRGDWAIQMWNQRGLDVGMQEFFTLGACEDFVINEGYHTPTLTIPIFGEQNNLLNIKHRLVNPQKPTDKYRPERSGLGSFPPFLAVPGRGFDGDLIVVTEGEIKAMVAYTKINESDIQVIGVPGRTQFKSLVDKLKGKNVVVIPDPGAEQDAYQFAKSIQARFLPFGSKVDDYILETGITSNSFYSMIKQARKA